MILFDLERNYQVGGVIFYNSDNFGCLESVITTLFKTKFFIGNVVSLFHEC